MPVEVPLRAITRGVLSDYYDAGSIGRGIDYHEDGRVTILQIGQGLITSVVAGSARNVYVVRVTWRAQGPDVVVGDECSCPLGGACKHAVATILTAQAHEQSADTDAGSSRAAWRQALEGIVDPAGGDEDPAVRLALAISVHTPRVGRYGPAPRRHLRALPMRIGKRGKWIKTGASWRDLSYPHHTGGVDTDQAGALRALWTASRSRSPYPDTDPIDLDAVGPELWPHLARIIETGVVLIDSAGDPVVSVSPERAGAQVDLTAAADGAVTVTTSLTLDGAPLHVSADELTAIGGPPHGVALVRDGGIRLIPLTKPLHPALARLLSSPPLEVPAGEVDELLDVYQPHLARRAEVTSSDGSVTITRRRFDGLTLIVRRHALDVVTTEWAARYLRGDTVTNFPFGDPGGTLRDRHAEADAATALRLPDALRPLLLGPHGTPRGRTLRGLDAIAVLTDAVPWLQQHSPLHVEVVDAGDVVLPELREATDDPLIALGVTDAADDGGATDWFDLTVSVSVDGEHVPFAALFRALSAEEPVLVLASGTWLRLDREEFARLKSLIAEARGLVDADSDDDTVRINRFQVSWFEELAQLGVIAEQSESWAANLEGMASLTAPEPTPPPATLKAELRPYQSEGLAWLEFIAANRLGGILADDMGLGKTVQILSLCLRLAESRPDARFLVVAPTSVVENWHREAARFAPTMSVVTVTETERRRGTPLTEAIRDATMVVTSYTLFRLEFDDYAGQDWDLLLLDEAQFVKNHQGKTYRCVRALAAETKIAITGTPMENSLMDLWSLLSIVAPGLYPDPQRFTQVYTKPIERGDAPELLATLRRRIAPLMRRRTKAAVLTELPPKTEQVIEVDLHSRHRRIYETRLQRERSKVLGLVDDVQRHRFMIFKSLTLLRQLSLDPGLVDPSDDHVGSAKLDRLVDDVTQVVAEGHRALVFSQFTRYLTRARERLVSAGIDTTYLDGRTRRRAQVIDAFKSGDVPVFLISLKAGGVGLNLAEADYCFILDPWWNPATETQAIDRAHRIGQVNPVVVYRYVSTGTIEEKVMELKARKAALFSDVVDADGALSGSLTADDIRGLFDAG